MTTATTTIEGLDICDIKNILPHRYPFLLVDRVTWCEPGKAARGYKNVSANEPHFQGHFPIKPIMPGVLMLEALAQLGCVAILSHPDFKDKLGLFTGIDNVKFRTMVEPGDRLDMEVELVKMKGPLGKFKAIAKVGDKLACEADISFSMVETSRIKTSKV
ncbi:MAG: 3-hydroxyacyl-ACP dehydratase FabZ [Cyanobacteria bacterium]|nr:3-hydroxyacyl-ACP dehydratase FabZ [Cyanobacteriota bacterium]